MAKAKPSVWDTGQASLLIYLDEGRKMDFSPLLWLDLFPKVNFLLLASNRKVNFEKSRRQRLSVHAKKQCNKHTQMNLSFVKVLDHSADEDFCLKRQIQIFVMKLSVQLQMISCRISDAGKRFAQMLNEFPLFTKKLKHVCAATSASIRCYNALARSWKIHYSNCSQNNSKFQCKPWLYF